jgi:hypothetical protein
MSLAAERMDVQFATERRRGSRFSVALPVILHCEGKKYAATVSNLSSDGAMVRSTLQGRVGTAVVISCGTTEVAATVTWSGAAHAGLTFTRSLSDAELAEHLARSQAIAARRARR